MISTEHFCNYATQQCHIFCTFKVGMTIRIPGVQTDTCGECGYLDLRGRHVNSQCDQGQDQYDVGKCIVWRKKNCHSQLIITPLKHHHQLDVNHSCCSCCCSVILTEQSSTHRLQHGEDGEEVQSCIDALEAVRFTQTTGNFLNQQRAQQHHEHQAEGVVDQHDGVAEVGKQQIRKLLQQIT